MQVRALTNLCSDRLSALPVAILYITDKCNSRCVCCDYWRSGHREIPPEVAARLARELTGFGMRYVLLSGGEPLQHSCWQEIAAAFKKEGARVAMATSGILLPRHAADVRRWIDEIYISLDGATSATYQEIRGVDGFDLVREGTAALAGSLPVTLRTTVQRVNYRELPALVRLTRSWGVDHHSFLAVDVRTHAAFARSDRFERSMALREEDLEPFLVVLDEMEREFREEFSRCFIPESMQKMRGLHRYFAALLGHGDFPPVLCNAPRFSAVIETDGSIKPCFFLPTSGRYEGGRISNVLNTANAMELRRSQRRGGREECRSCVCPSYKGVRAILGVA